MRLRRKPKNPAVAPVVKANRHHICQPPVVANNPYVFCDSMLWTCAPCGRLFRLEWPNIPLHYTDEPEPDKAVWQPLGDF